MGAGLLAFAFLTTCLSATLPRMWVARVVDIEDADGKMVPTTYYQQLDRSSVNPFGKPIFQEPKAVDFRNLRKGMIVYSRFTFTGNTIPEEFEVMNEPGSFKLDFLGDIMPGVTLRNLKTSEAEPYGRESENWNEWWTFDSRMRRRLPSDDTPRH